MAGTEPQKQLLTLIRDFASEKSQGERRIVGLKNRTQQLRSELDLANSELEDAKRLKETTEQELKGYEVELAMNEAFIQTLETRISLIQDEISIAGSDLESIKNEEEALRDDFISKMFELNTNIRKFQERIACAFCEDNSIQTSMNDAGQKLSDAEDPEVSRRDLDNKIAEIISQTTVEEQECQAEQTIHKQVQEELIDLERKVFLMESIMKESIELQDLTRQTSEFEERCASLGEELQRRCICPSCHLDNVEALDGILQASDGN
ncbi:tropomyosin isoform X2 [Camellia sinensis]|uniref:tropomyosin isoform X2 n=1 Tax=Camellia sinensis TaxID=4442 RepID=UPI001035E269|nr:tropomyosin isoform X2 [Camellia sinensis]